MEISFLKHLKSTSLLCALIFIMGTIQMFLYAYSHGLDGDVTQLLDRALELYTKSNWIHYGPAASSGTSGHVPGSFLTFITGVPFFIYESPWSSLVILGFLHLFGFILLIKSFKPVLSDWGLVFLFLFYWLNPYRNSEVFLWNPAYMFFISCGHIYTSLKLMDESLSYKKKFIYSFFHLLLLGIGAQIHPSILILMGVSTYLWLRGPLRVSYGGAFFGGVVVLLSLVPFFNELLIHPELLPKARSDNEAHLFYGLYNVWPMLKGLWYWFVFSGFSPPSHLFKYINFNWMGDWGDKFYILWNLVKNMMALLGIVISFYVNFLFIKKNKGLFQFFGKNFFISLKEKSKKTDHEYKNHRHLCLSLYISGTLLSILLFSALSPTTPQFWHILYVFPVALYPFLNYISLNQIFLKKIKYINLFFILFFYFSVFNLFGALESKKHNFQKSFHKSYLEYKADWERKNISVPNDD